MIPLDNVVFRDDLDPRLGRRDGDLIQQYTEIVDELPPIEINHENELIDCWHRVRAAEHAERNEIAFIVVETDGDVHMRDRMYVANLRHGVQYTRVQKKAYGITLHERKQAAKEIARLSGVGVSTVYRWTTELRDLEKDERNEDIVRMSDKGKTTREIADKVGFDHTTVAAVLENSQMREIQQEPKRETGSEIEADKAKTGEALCILGLTAGEETSTATLRLVKDALPEITVAAKTGVHHANVAEQLHIADAAIIGTAFKRDGVFKNPS